MKLIKDANTGYYFKSFSSNGGLSFTKNWKEALNLWDADCDPCTSEKTVKRMLAAWYGKPFSKTGLKVIDTSVSGLDL